VDELPKPVLVSRYLADINFFTKLWKFGIFVTTNQKGNQRVVNKNNKF
jgi:hypothetical protein